MADTSFPQLPTWDVNQKVNRFMLNHIEESLLMERPSETGPSIGEQFGQMHTVRLMWLQVAAPDLWRSSQRIDKQQIRSTIYLQQRLKASAHAVRELMIRSFTQGKVTGFSSTPDIFLSYLIAHESHHRGQILLTLKINDHQIPEEFEQAIWDWGKMAK
ncbi:MAG: DinB family protein [Bacteroidota bacterium]